MSISIYIYIYTHVHDICMYINICKIISTLMFCHLFSYFFFVNSAGDSNSMAKKRPALRRVSSLRFPQPGGIPKRWFLSWNIQLKKIDDDWGYPYFRKHPFVDMCVYVAWLFFTCFWQAEWTLYISVMSHESEYDCRWSRAFDVDKPPKFRLQRHHFFFEKREVERKGYTWIWWYTH